MKEIKAVFSVLVVNHPGVLLRVSGLFSRRGFNIDSLVACSTDNPEYSRLTIVTKGDDNVFAQITRQLLKLEDTIKVTMLEEDKLSSSELLLIKVAADESTRTEILRYAQTYGARVLDVGKRSVTLEMSGQGEVLDRFIKKASKYGLLELARTGANVLERGDLTIYDDLTV